ncbi:MAG: hypothetical protein RIR18_132 [Pseudomonadota bacterium]|jgi:methyl-accepting chemotaxis protein-2 (aspartate sensor receptor)
MIFSALRSTRDWPIATKLNSVQATATISLLLVAITVLTVWLSGVLQEKNVGNIRQANQQAVDLIDAYSSSLEKNAEKLGNVLISQYPSGFTLDASASVDIAGKATPLLKSGGSTLNLNFENIDHFTAITGVVATIFAREGDDFVRVTTSLKKENGERAVGTNLGVTHPARERLLKGEAFTGKARLFGRDYMTRYIPQQDKSGKVVAVLFIGLDFTSELVVLKEKIRGVRFNKSGYIFGLDAGKDKGTLVIHPAQEGKNLLDATDPNGVAYIKDMIDKKNGQIEYQFMNPSLGETEPRTKIAVFMHYPKWDWIIASSCYLDELSEEAAAVRNRLILAGLLLAAILCLVTYVSLKIWVTSPLQGTVSAMQSIAQGNLVVELPPHGKDEVGQLLIATKQMAGSMIDAIADIQAASMQLVSSAKELSKASHHVAAQSGLQSDAAATMAASVEEMETSISHVRDCAIDTQKITDSAGKTSVEGALIIDQAVNSMAQIAATVREASTSVTQLGQESEAIAAIVNTIKGIADQTNLLALNAAIEAARAGEAGRGFAVVADEVRKLAERTTVSTQEIEGMIGKILSGTRDAVGSIETGVVQVEGGVTLASQAGNSIAAIRNGAEQVAEAVSSISSALAEQSSASAEISRNVVNIAATADENACMAKTSAEHADALEDLANTLTSRISKFTIGSKSQQSSVDLW